VEKLLTDPVMDKNKIKCAFLKENMVCSKSANSQNNILVSSFYHYLQLNPTKLFMDFVTNKIHFMQDVTMDNRASISNTFLEEVFIIFLMIANCCVLVQKIPSMAIIICGRNKRVSQSPLLWSLVVNKLHLDFEVILKHNFVK
jgi:hypothetical protein